MLIFEGAAIYIVCQLVNQRAARWTQLDVLKNRLAQRHPHVVAAGKSATFLSHLRPSSLDSLALAFPVGCFWRNRLARGNQLIVRQTLKPPPESLRIEESVVHGHDLAF
jgi:hypothetical protein